MRKGFLLSLLRYVLTLILFLVLAFALFAWWALGGELPKFSEPGVNVSVNPKEVEPPKFLTVASYNIGHGQGIKENAWDYRDKETTQRQLDRVADAMNKIDADIFMLQEVDLHSNRTHYIDQVEFLKEKTGHDYSACALVWKKNYIPFPYFPLAHHIGYVRAANCILSRFPLSQHESIIFEKPRSHAWWYNLGYIDRGLHRVDAIIGDKKISLINVHLEAWEVEARESQIKITDEYIKKIKNPVILAGDFNTVLPDAPQLKDFVDEPEADFSGDQTFIWLFKNNSGLKKPKLISEIGDPKARFTFPADEPTRRLDHIYLQGDTLDFVSFRVASEANTASDHLPVVARIKY